MKKRITVAIVGLGARGMHYARYNSRTCRRDGSGIKDTGDELLSVWRGTAGGRPVGRRYVYLYSGQAAYKTSNRGHEEGVPSSAGKTHISISRGVGRT